MSVAGLCQICETEMARHTCRRCGRVVCGDHWNDAEGVCTDCVQGRQQ